MSRKAKVLSVLASPAGRKAVGALVGVVLTFAGLGHLAGTGSQVAGEAVGEVAEQLQGGKPPECDCSCPEVPASAG